VPPEPARTEECPPAPRHLRGYAREAWLELAPELHRLNLLTVLDVAPFSVYCAAYATWRQADEALAREGTLTITTAEGHQRVNPLVRISSQAMNDMLRYGAAFGLSPAGRLRLSGTNPPAPPSKFDGLLGS
jgi:P27 family predicted phage terminase small subunit